MLVIVVEFESREKKRKIGNRLPIVTKKEEENRLVSCMRWLGDGCFTAIIKQRQIERREKENSVMKRKWYWNSIRRRTNKRRKKGEKKRSEKEQHQDIETLYPLLRKWYTFNLRASPKKREEGERKIYIYSLPLSTFNGTLH